MKVDSLQITILAAIFVVVLAFVALESWETGIDSGRDQVQTQAVGRGYAEWVVEKGVRTWRWKDISSIKAVAQSEGGDK